MLTCTVRPLEGTLHRPYATPLISAIEQRFDLAAGAAQLGEKPVLLAGKASGRYRDGHGERAPEWIEKGGTDGHDALGVLFPIVGELGAAALLDLAPQVIEVGERVRRMGA